MKQKLHFLGRRIDFFPVYRELKGVHIDNQPVEHQLIGLFLHAVAGAAEDGLALPAACRTVLLPGYAWGLPEGLRAASAVSYGASPKNSLTVSSRRGERLWAALQRELVTVEGRVVERQEFPVPFLSHGELASLAVAGALLLLGVPPEELDLQEK